MSEVKEIYSDHSKEVRKEMHKILKDIVTPAGIVYPVEKVADYYVNASTIIYGPSNSGKTKIINEIMYLCRNIIPNVIVICNQNSQKNYNGKVPALCIKNDLTKENLISIWQRQADLKRVCNAADNLVNLRKLYNRCRSSAIDSKLNTFEREYNQHVARIQNDSSLNVESQQTQLNRLCEFYEDGVRKIYKQQIAKNLAILYGMFDELCIEEKICLTYYDTNPKLMLIFDDVTEMFKKWMGYFKKEANPFHSIFFQGRHNDISIVIAAHDNKFILPELRKNARNAFFTHMAPLTVSLRDSPAHERRQIQTLAGAVFDVENEEKTGIKKFQKYCYIREDTRPHRYTVASLYGDFKVGCSQLWDLSKKLEGKKNDLSKNKFVSDLMDI